MMKKEKWEKLFVKYGVDFLKKLPMYETATLNGKHVKIVYVDMVQMLAQVMPAGGGHLQWVDIAELDNFVL
jgi:hypothetical protein